MSLRTLTNELRERGDDVGTPFPAILDDNLAVMVRAVLELAAVWYPPDYDDPEHRGVANLNRLVVRPADVPVVSQPAAGRLGGRRNFNGGIPPGMKGKRHALTA